MNGIDSDIKKQDMKKWSGSNWLRRGPNNGFT
jgi:hypothetical protein